MTTICLPLTRARSAAQCGGKGANLGSLLRSGIDVPAGFVITRVAFERFLSENRIRERIDELLSRVDFSSHAAIREAAATVRSLVMSTPIPKVIASEAEELRKRLHSPRIIVRSSAVGEDSHADSFAGQLDSFPIQNSSAEFEHALKACWASFWSERVLFYQKARGTRLSGMGVVVQEMVEPHLSGVVFSIAPGAAGKDCLLVEYVAGEGHLLVGGEVNPGRISLTRDGRERHVLALPEQSGCPPLAESPLLETLRVTSLAIERHMGGPQDIEWCVDGEGRLRIVQARPITTECAESASLLWSNVNVNENYPDPVTPLLYSIARRSYEHYFSSLGHAFGVSQSRLESMRHELGQVIGLHGGRIYYNLTNIYRLISLLPFGDRAAAYFDDFIGVSALSSARVRHVSRFRELRFWLQGLELVSIGLTTLRTITRIPRRVKSLEEDVDQHVDMCESHRPGLHAIPEPEELQREFSGFLAVRFGKWRKGALADAASMFSYGLLCSFLRRRLGDSHHHSLLKAIPNVVSCIPPQKLWEIAEVVRSEPDLRSFVTARSAAELDAQLDHLPLLKPLQTRVSEFQRQWGFRCSGELMLSLPNYRDNRTAVLELVKAYCATQAPSPATLMHEQARERQGLEREVAKRLAAPLPPPLSPSAWLFRILLRLTHASIALRERVRMKQAKLYAQFRQTLLDLGRRWQDSSALAAPEDIFFLRYEEIERGLAGDAQMLQSARLTVAQRQAEHETVTRHAPPETFRTRLGETYVPVSPAEDNEPRTRLVGLGACGGRVESAARVLTSVLDADRLQHGDVLVTRQTDPGWAPVFPLIKGLVMERGGMLSHGAIVAREFGIPAVVGIRGVASAIQSGERIVVDGDHGSVELCR